MDFDWRMGTGGCRVRKREVTYKYFSTLFVNWDSCTLLKSELYIIIIIITIIIIKEWIIYNSLFNNVQESQFTNKVEKYLYVTSRLRTRHPPVPFRQSKSMFYLHPYTGHIMIWIRLTTTPINPLCSFVYEVILAESAEAFRFGCR